MGETCWFCNGPILPGEKIERGVYGVEYIDPDTGKVVETKEGPMVWHTACADRIGAEPGWPPHPHGFDNVV